MLGLFKRAYLAAITFEGERAKVLEFVKLRSVGQPQQFRILDVGCGYGRFIRMFLACGFDVTGVETNADILSANLAEGLPCVSIEEFERGAAMYDVILMSHVVEHFPPHELLEFIDRYLDRLNVGGHLVIATPLPSNNFYDDFDHVRPYQPMGFQMAFGSGKAQIQYYSRNKLELRDVWFRHSPWRINYCRARYIFGPVTRLLQLTDIVAALLCRLSGGLLGRTDGWVGCFRKTA